MRLKLAVITLVWLVLLPDLHALRLGETKEQIDAKHGTPTMQDRSKNTATYWWDVWSVEVRFKDEIARELVYKKRSQFTDAEVARILEDNADTWSETALNSTKTRLWSNNSLGLTAIFYQSESPQRLTVESALLGAIRDRSRPSPTTHSTPLPTTVTQHETLTPLRPTNALNPLTTSRPAIRQPLVFNDEVVKMMMGAVLGSVALAFMGFIILTVMRKGAFSLMNRVKGSQSTPPPIPTSPVSLNSGPHANLQTLNWSQFELLVAEIYRRKGYQITISAGLGADGGVDLKMTRDGELTLVQCKHWKTYKIGVKEIRELYGVQTAKNARHALFITTGEYSRDAWSFAEGKPIQLLDRPDVEELMREVAKPGENVCNIESWLPDFRREVVIAETLCPQCNQRMVIRNGRDSSRFWGCSIYPRCRGKRDARLELLS